MRPFFIQVAELNDSTVFFNADDFKSDAGELSTRCSFSKEYPDGDKIIIPVPTPFKERDYRSGDNILDQRVYLTRRDALELYVQNKKTIEQAKALDSAIGEVTE